MTTSGDEYWSLRCGLVDTLLEEGLVRSESVGAAIRAVPRHHFVSGVSALEAYENVSIPIQDDAGDWVSSLSEPGWVATTLEELELVPGMRVLEVGAGTGYHAALLARLVGKAGRVVSVEIESWLAEQARVRLEALELSQVTVVTGDGALGVPREAPFDRILLTTGTWEVFPAWLEQLVPGGRLVVPIQFGGAEKQACILVSLVGEDDCLVGKPVMGANMVPIRGEIGGVREAESTRAGASWRPTPTDELISVRVFPRDLPVEPGTNQKLFVRGSCQILLERRAS